MIKKQEKYSELITKYNAKYRYECNAGHIEIHQNIGSNGKVEPPIFYIELVHSGDKRDLIEMQEIIQLAVILMTKLNTNQFTENPMNEKENYIISNWIYPA
jgi:hypothetical protein